MKRAWRTGARPRGVWLVALEARYPAGRTNKTVLMERTKRHHNHHTAAALNKKDAGKTNGTRKIQKRYQTVYIMNGVYTTSSMYPGWYHTKQHRMGGGWTNTRGQTLFIAVTLYTLVKYDGSFGAHIHTHDDDGASWPKPLSAYLWREPQSIIECSIGQ